MILFIKLFKESALFAWGSLVSNKLRTLLTLLGITIGIFAIISVFSVVDALEREIRSSITSLGDNVIYIQKWPWEFGPDYAWWRYMNRPNVKPWEMEEMMRRSNLVEFAVYTATTNKTVEFQNKNIEQVTIFSVSHDYDKVRTFELENGRYFSFSESSSGRNVAILGHEIAQKLFGAENPVGKNIKTFGRRLEVVGVLTREGQAPFSNSHDELIIVPINWINTIIDVSGDSYGPSVLARGKPNITNEEMIDELRGIMRSLRRLKPAADDNFALNQTSLLTQGFDGLFAILKITGWIIGGFSILVGGFGIANIMFVSVKERTTIIGIQKAMGAKNYFILLQFLTESVLLSLLGGIIGLLLVLGGTWVASAALDFNLMLLPDNILLGINVSVIIGLMAGFIPAWSAARLNPVDAIRANT